MENFDNLFRSLICRGFHLIINLFIWLVILMALKNYFCVVASYGAQQENSKQLNNWCQHFGDMDSTYIDS